MLGGAADATPGMLSNCTYRRFSIKPTGRPDCTGTRANGMAMYVVFHQTLGFVSDSPTEYEKFPDIMEWLKRVPTVWDETLPLAGEMSEYIIMARRKGQEWWVGAMNKMDNQHTQYSRDIHIDFSFLTPGVTYEAYIIKDVENCNRDATLYEIEQVELTAESAEEYWLANGGGIAMRIYPKGSDNVSTIEQDNKAVSVNYDTTAQQLTVDSTKPIDALYIIDVLGRVQPVVATLPARHIELPVNNLESGMYWLVTTIAQENITSQFIK
jgi:alpha-glucosidase